MKARYKGVCPKPCKKGGKIKPGQEIVKIPNGPSKHAECAGVQVQLKLSLK